jgi:16S rRNA (guanine966-N2)-methyltransferase
MASSKSKRPSHSQLRIIGGKWRGRKLTFTPAEGLRPTTDRIRETLFNWLSPAVSGARCADLFSGSGALGLEALSRGASHCDFVDSSKVAVRQISIHLDTLGASGNGQCHNCPAKHYLADSTEPLDIVFIDPPFTKGLVEPICQQLSDTGLLAPEALIYIETPVEEALTNLPNNWSLHREKQAGAVAYRLFRTPAV